LTETLAVTATPIHAHFFFKVPTLPHSHNTEEFNPLNAKLNPTCHWLGLLGAHHILHISRIKVKSHLAVNNLHSHYVERKYKNMQYTLCNGTHTALLAVKVLHLSSRLL
jgi:hypothetical protein